MLTSVARALRRRFLGARPVEFQDRTPRARTIEAILSVQLGRPVLGQDILDVGCGNGDISRYFARQNRVVGVDVKDRRNGRAEPFEFVQLTSERLPLADQSFDVVLSHHVIEHVPNQRLHLDEVHRVLRSGGVCYLGTPNRTSPIMQGHEGNDMVLRYAQMQPLFEASGFRVTEVTSDVLLHPDRYHYSLQLGRFLPWRLAQGLRRWYPSHMFLLAKPRME